MPRIRAVVAPTGETIDRADDDNATLEVAIHDVTLYTFNLKTTGDGYIVQFLCPLSQGEGIIQLAPLIQRTMDLKVTAHLSSRTLAKLRGHT